MFFAGQVEEENQGDQVNLENNHCNRGCAIRSCGLHWPAYMVDVCARVLMTGFIWFVFLCASQGETHGLQVASVDCRWVSQCCRRAHSAAFSVDVLQWSLVWDCVECISVVLYCVVLLFSHNLYLKQPQLFLGASTYTIKQRTTVSWNLLL